jgi:hypothetical protein
MGPEILAWACRLFMHGFYLANFSLRVIYPAHIKSGTHSVVFLVKL